MCVILHKPKNVKVLKKTLEQCWKANSDGAGFMFADGSQVYVIKGLMTYKKFLKAYLPHEKREMVIHFRNASIGATSKKQTHPFYINGKLAVCHNGTISADYVWDNSGSGSTRATSGKGDSDTKVFVEDILQKLPPEFLRNKAIVELLKEYSKGSALVFMNEKSNVTIIGQFGTPIIRKGVWFSNDSWLDMYEWIDYSIPRGKKSTSKVEEVIASVQRDNRKKSYGYSGMCDYGIIDSMNILKD